MRGVGVEGNQALRDMLQVRNRFSHGRLRAQVLSRGRERPTRRLPKGARAPPVPITCTHLVLLPGATTAATRQKGPLGFFLIMGML